MAGVELAEAFLARGARLRFCTSCAGSVSPRLPAAVGRAGGRALGRAGPLAAATVAPGAGAPPCTMMLPSRLRGTTLEEASAADPTWPVGRSTAAPPAVDLANPTSTVTSAGSEVSMASLDGLGEVGQSGRWSRWRRPT